MKKIVKIISLGDLITPDFNKVILAFAQLINQKSPQLNQSVILDAISNTIPKTKSNLDKFNLGEITEKEFTEKMLVALQKETNVLLTFEEFDSAWSAMYSEFATYRTFLEEASYYNKQTQHQLIFISYTNPKDIRNITNQLSMHNIPHQFENNILSEIDGMPIYMSYVAKQNKTKLLASTIQAVNNSFQAKNFFSRFFQLISSKKQVDITYICCENAITNPLLKASLDQQNFELGQTLKNLSIDTYIWNKADESLFDVLNDPQVSLNPELSTSTTMLCN
ncbi:MAG: hypothetical protein REH83_02950 [Rickettsiella sp.]|nr:hypothetical protein [Rickettsiella sp.]